MDAINYAPTEEKGEATITIESFALYQPAMVDARAITELSNICVLILAHVD
jgi:hypothetical protein